MFRYIRNNIITIRGAAGLDIHFLENDRMIISGVMVRPVKGQVRKTADFERISNWEVLKDKLPANVPVAVTLNGKGILMRTNDRGTSENLISTLFPGANPQDFVYTTHRTGEGAEKVYIARKTYIEDIIKQMSQAGIRLVSLTLGSNPVEIVLPFMNKWNTGIITPTLRLEITERKVHTVIPENAAGSVYKEVEIGETRYRTSQVLGLGGALALLLKPADRVHSDIRTTGISYLQKEYVYYKLFRFTGWAMLITTLALLLVNFFVFNNYYSKNKELAQSNELINSQLAGNDAAGAQLDSAYSFFTRSGWDKTTRHGFYIDRIAALVPPSVSLTSLQAAPLQESIGVSEYIFDHGKIWISGASVDPTELETFSRAIRNISGVQSVSIKSYLYKAEQQAAVFTIEVKVAT
ncbi:MAG: hypothetical protein QM640_03205 [Niabella sp.]